MYANEIYLNCFVTVSPEFSFGHQSIIRFYWALKLQFQEVYNCLNIEKYLRICAIMAYRSFLILLHNPDPVTPFSGFISLLSISSSHGALSLLIHRPQ